MNQVRANLEIDSALLAQAREYADNAGLTLDEVISDAVAGHLLSARVHASLGSAADSMRAVCEASGYTDYTPYPSGRDACLARFGFTVAILADMTPDGHGDRWCYDTIEQARAALEAWNGEHDTEPQGWHRHPTTGRRRPDGDAAREYIAF